MKVKTFRNLYDKFVKEDQKQRKKEFIIRFT